MVFNRSKGCFLAKLDKTEREKEREPFHLSLFYIFHLYGISKSITRFQIYC